MKTTLEGTNKKSYLFKLTPVISSFRDKITRFPSFFITLFLALLVTLGVSTAPALAASSWVQESQSTLEELEALSSLLLEYGFSEEEVLSVLEEGDLDVALELQHLLDKGFLIADSDDKKDKDDYTKKELKKIKGGCADGSFSAKLCLDLGFKFKIRTKKKEVTVDGDDGYCISVCVKNRPPVKAPKPTAKPPKTPPAEAPASETPTSDKRIYHGGGYLLL